MQTEPSVKALRSAFSAKFWRNSTPRFAPTPERRNGNVNLNKNFTLSSGIESTTNRVYSHTLVPNILVTDLNKNIYISNIYLKYEYGDFIGYVVAFCLQFI